MENERAVYCPKCGHAIRRVDIDNENYKNLGIALYEARCVNCLVTVEIEDRSNFEQKGKIKITFN